MKKQKEYSRVAFREGARLNEYRPVENKGIIREEKLKGNDS
jgi:hypothetical protein|tara:strand:+ start:72 stop:194 length:123 start_codon:yes stop_codon:yes gene_type:complete